MSNLKPIKNTRMRRFAVLAAVELLGRWRPRFGNVLFLTNKICVKYGSLRTLSEASTLQFVAENTSIPVPKVYCAFVHRGWTYIAMSVIEGHKLAIGWFSRSAESKEKILAQLSKMVKEIRAIPAPSPGVSNVDGGPIFDGRLPGRTMTFGPFETIQDFHTFFRNGVQSHSDPEHEINKMISLQDRPWSEPVFTHGDLSSLNILVRGDEVVGIIDWETAGWFPSYWEYTTACQVNPRNYFWREEIDKFLEPNSEALEMDVIRLKYFGDV